jgi:hypothetical protein
MQSIDSHLIHGLETIPDDELLRRLADLLAGSRHTEADLVAHIGEVDARRLYAREATPSMFVYCTERLHLSEGEACLRIAAARASRQHPVLLEMLAAGRLHLSAIARIAPFLTPENRDALLRRATHKTKREVDELVAELAPRRDVPASMRKLPAGRFVAGPAAAVRTDLGGVSQGGVDSAPRPERVDSARSDDSRDLATAQTAEQGTDLALLQGCAAPSGEARSDVVTARSIVEAPSETAAAPDAVPRLSNDEAPAQRRLPWTAAPRSRPAVIEPLSPARYRVQFTASAELREKLERLRALMRSSVPDGDLAAVIGAAVTEKLERLEARRFGRTKAPRKTLAETDASPRTREVPAVVKRAVSERDEDRCRYTDAHGNRCSARVRLEYHHRHTFALGGDHSLRNVALLCGLHNRLLAEIDYGHEAVGRHRRSGPARSQGPATVARGPSMA